ncbi:MAG: 30S ribosomal protein S16 [Candidatus Saccharimonadales bacterium]
MLVIRMQRTGRRGHAQFRVVVQDSRRTPTSGKIVAHLGHFDPHSKQTVLDKEKAEFYLSHGAQPSARVARLLKIEGVKLPAWINTESQKSGSIKNTDKLRRNRPTEPKAEPEPVASESAEEPSAEPAEASGAEPVAEESKPEAEAAPQPTPEKASENQPPA